MTATSRLTCAKAQKHPPPPPLPRLREYLPGRVFLTLLASETLSQARDIGQGRPTEELLSIFGIFYLTYFCH